MSWVQRFEIFHHWKVSFDEAITTIYLVYRPKNNAPPVRLAVSLLLAVRRSPGESLIRSDLPPWARLAERGEEMEYLTPKPGSECWKVIYLRSLFIFKSTGHTSINYMKLWHFLGFVSGDWTRLDSSRWFDGAACVSTLQTTRHGE